MKHLAILLAPLLIGAATPSSCLVVGDSIAKGVASYMPACSVAARIGASSARIKEMTPKEKYGRVIISAGSNDPLNPKLGANLFAIRKNFAGSQVTWLAPRNSRAQQRVYETAVYFKDRVVYLSQFKSSDGIHPKNYAQVARKL